MKEKKSTKRLVFHKETISDLDNRSMEAVRGGACTYPPTGCTLVRLCCTMGGNYNTCEPPITEPYTTCMD